MKGFSILIRPRSFFFLLPFTVLLIVLFLAYLIPFNFNLLGYQSVSGDSAQHLSGWYAFSQEPWHFPLLKINSFNYPVGASLTFTDSIPLFGLIFKLLRSFFPQDFNYFGLFFIVAVMSQAIGAQVLAHATKQNSFLGVFYYVSFALTAPIFLSNIGTEDSLAAQSLILLALSGYYFVIHDQLPLKGLSILFGLLIGLSLLIHPDLTALVYPFYWISLARYQRQASTPWKKLLPGITLLHLLLLAEIWIFGLMMDTRPVDGFGLLTINLLAPFHGGWLFHQTSIAGPKQFGASVYLGVGLILLLGLSCIRPHPVFSQTLQQNRSLAGLILFFLFLSLYGNVYFGQTFLFYLGHPHFFLTYDFRVNGRFFWPVWYAAMIFALLGWMAHPSRVRTTVLLLAVLLQLADTFGYVQETKQTLSHLFTPTPAQPTQQIEQLMRQSQLIIFYPNMACSNMQPADLNLLTNTIQLLAGKTGTPLNTVYLAHFESNHHCADQAQDFPAVGHKLLISTVTHPSPTISMLLHQHPNPCQVIDHAYYCPYATGSSKPSPSTHTRSS